MPENLITPEAISEYGLETIVVCFFLWLVWYLFKTLKPTIEQTITTSKDVKNIVEALNDTLQNNTAAISEVSRSNDNVAAAIRLLDNTLHKVDDNVSRLENKVDNVTNKTDQLLIDGARNCELLRFYIGADEK